MRWGPNSSSPGLQRAGLHPVPCPGNCPCSPTPGDSKAFGGPRQTSCFLPASGFILCFLSTGSIVCFPAGRPPRAVETREGILRPGFLRAGMGCRQESSEPSFLIQLSAFHTALGTGQCASRVAARSPRTGQRSSSGVASPCLLFCSWNSGCKQRSWVFCLGQGGPSRPSG